ncbi:MAG: tetratricopeptide repeat protein, partial [Deltaproteobacteria bacterium]|nr:tetratricopeptide repeat protein [Deltaproteobacteria bacterium]
MQKVKPMLPIAVLVLACVIVYFNTLSNEFVFDDRATIVENKYLSDFKGSLPAFFSTSYFEIAEAEASYRPVATLSYYMFYAIGELNPFWYHLGSLILHILNVLLVYFVTLVIQKDQRAALVAGLLFACHPAVTEAVNCISFNEDLLAAMFYLMSFLLYMRTAPDRKTPAVTGFILALLLYFLGLLSKEMAITLPMMIVVYDLAINAPDGDSLSFASMRATIADRIFYYLGFAGVSLFYLSLRFVFLTGSEPAASLTYGSLLERIVYLPYQFFNFIRLVVFPYPLKAEYIFSYPESFFEIYNIIAVIAFIGVIGFSIYIYRKFKAVSFGIWWFLITLLPVSNLIEITNPVAERYLYLPAVGFCMALAILLVNIPRQIPGLNIEKSKVVGSCVILLVVLYAVVTVNRNSDWKDGLSLWSQTLEHVPNSPGVHSNLGRAYFENGKVEEAVNEFKAAIELDPKAYKAHYNLGVAYEKKGLIPEA